MLPREFPPKSTVYGYFRRFGQEGFWQCIWLVLTMAAREQAGKEAQPSAGLIDSRASRPPKPVGRAGSTWATDAGGAKLAPVLLVQPCTGAL